MKILHKLTTWFDAWLSLDMKPKLRPVRHVDISRYMGSWRIIAFMDNPLEHDFVDAVETYTFAGGNCVQVHFEWRSESFIAPVKTHDFRGNIEKDGSNAKWRMRLVPIVSVAYVIIHVSSDYTLAAVAHPSRKFGWVLARQRTISEEDYTRMMEVFAREHYDVTKFIRVPQSPPPRSPISAALLRVS